MSKLLVFATLVFAGVLLTTLVFVNVNGSLRKTRHQQGQGQGQAQGQVPFYYDWSQGLQAPIYGEQHEPQDFSYQHEQEGRGQLPEVEGVEPCEAEHFFYNHLACCQSFCNLHFTNDVQTNFRFASRGAALGDQAARRAALEAFLDGRQQKLATCFGNCARIANSTVAAAPVQGV